VFSSTRLWAHEVTRVFHDRLSSEANRTWFFGLLGSTLETDLQAGLQTLFLRPPAVAAAPTEAQMARLVTDAQAAAPAADAGSFGLLKEAEVEGATADALVATALSTVTAPTPEPTTGCNTDTAAACAIDATDALKKLMFCDFLGQVGSQIWLIY
jgi:hypothetical protein